MLNKWQPFFFSKEAAHFFFSDLIFHKEIFILLPRKEQHFMVPCVFVSYIKSDFLIFHHSLSINYFSRSGLPFHLGGKSWTLTVHILLGEVQVVSVTLLLWYALLYSLGLYFVHLCFSSLPVCVKFATAVTLKVVEDR